MRIIFSWIVFILTFLAVGLVMNHTGSDFGSVLVVGGSISVSAAVLGYVLSRGYKDES